MYPIRIAISYPRNYNTEDMVTLEKNPKTKEIGEQSLFDQVTQVWERFDGIEPVSPDEIIPGRYIGIIKEVKLADDSEKVRKTIEIVKLEEPVLRSTFFKDEYGKGKWRIVTALAQDNQPLPMDVMLTNRDGMLTGNGGLTASGRVITVADGSVSFIRIPQETVQQISGWINDDKLDFVLKQPPFFTACPIQNKP